MLELKNIHKYYPAGDGEVHALKGIDLKFRHNEFVAVLGPSGCGKTTMLNIIGGLDQYTSGDLVINGKSTKDFNDRDWDTYRNHSIGFVFQSYNLIPHQSVLQNVELALTLSGVSKAERRSRAKKALEDVGLASQMNKRPSEMSGGQMQRVAIARALVNNPDIILADEPTGALDTETSVQVMEILKEIAKDRLIIMVTHNPDLANQYATRIIRMLDGEITDDSAPLSYEECKKERAGEEEKRQAEESQKKPSMSFATAFSLSLKNLITKKGRTILTSFAGSIGIIGIALILSISQGLTAYIDTIQEETLSSYPLTIESSVTDLSGLMQTFMGATDENAKHDMDTVHPKSAIYDIIDTMNHLETTENDLKSFKKYIEKERKKDGSTLSEAISGVQYAYDLDLLVYTKNVDGEIVHSDAQELLQELAMEYMNIDMSTMMDSMDTGIMQYSPMAAMNNGASRIWQEMLPGKDGEPVSDLVKNQYDVVYGQWPDSYDEIVLVLDENNELDDMSLYTLGLESKDEIDKIMDAAMNETDLEKNTSTWTYEEVCGRQFRVILNADCYRYDEKTGLYTDLRDTDAGLQYLYDNGLDLKVSGIIRPKEDTQAAMLTGSIGYTSLLTEHVIEEGRDSEAAKAQMDHSEKDIFTGLLFKENASSQTDEEKESDIRNYIAGLDENGKAAFYVQIMSVPTKEQLDAAVAQTMGGMSEEEIKASLSQVLTEQMGMAEEEVTEYVDSMDEEERNETFTSILKEQIKMQTAQETIARLAGQTPAQLAAALDAQAPSFTREQCVLYFDEVLINNFSDSSYEDNLKELGYVDPDEPSAINLYASTFENKDVIIDEIEDYNDSVEEASKIEYTDYVGLMMSSMTTIINTITYVLIAFVAISLIVSSIMIGVITLISVQERTKEIGILRALGASKHDVSSMFNAETMIIGFSAGLLGVLVTCLLCLPINAVIHALTGINNINAYLPFAAAVILILISVGLTLFAGIIPSRSAAKKDPVVALRTE